MPSVELLSPAGGWDCLKAAVANGADAVYLGVERFNARRRAENFRSDELDEVVNFCHDCGVRVHLTLNTLVKNGEVSDYFRLLKKAYVSGVDAVILQDVSFIPSIKRNFSDLEVHVSTQAGVFNSYSKEIISGADRVIMPRELTLSQVKELHKRLSIPVEVFVQGALCFSVGGQCLMSSFLGGRSGNRGFCAQPCRKRYNKSFLLSAKDLCLIEKVPELIKSGVSALKIEGRLRSPEYVGAATSLYRRMLDTGGFDKDAYSDLRIAFNRGYTVGRMFRVEDVSSVASASKDGIPLGVLGEDGKITLESMLCVGDGVGVITPEGGAHGDIVRRIGHGGQDVPRAPAGSQVRLFLNASAGDRLIVTSGVERRKTHRFPHKGKIIVPRKSTPVVLPEVSEIHLFEERLLVKTYSLSDAEEALAAGASYVYYNVFSKDYPQKGGGVCPYVPRCLSEWNAADAVEKIRNLSPPSVLCGDAGVAASLNRWGTYLDISGNVFNDVSVGFWNSRGVVPVISPELSLKELKEFRDRRFASYVHGRVPLMTTRYKLSEERLRDDLGYVFPVRSELDYRQVLNSVPLELYDEVLKLRAAGVVQYLLDLEEDVGATVSAYKKILSGGGFRRPDVKYTLGHFKKGVE